MRKDKGEQGAPVDEENQLTALSSKVNKLQENNKTLIITLSKAKKQKGKASSRRSANDHKWAWKKIPPSKKEPKVKRVYGRTYHWCTNHQEWTLHKDSDCTYKPMAMENITEEVVTEKEENTASSKRPSYSQALKSLMTVIDDSDSEEE